MYYILPPKSRKAFQALSHVFQGRLCEVHQLDFHFRWISQDTPYICPTHPPKLEINIGL